MSWKVEGASGGIRHAKYYESFEVIPIFIAQTVSISAHCCYLKPTLGCMAESSVMCQWSASVVLYPGSSITFSDKLESIQGIAAKLCTKRWSEPPTILASDLNWPALCSRQKVLLCRRIIRNKSIISPSPYFFPPPHPNPRTHHPHSVHVLFARTTSFQSSFFCICL